MAEERAQRRLAAILASDVVGYSRLMERDVAAHDDDGIEDRSIFAILKGVAPNLPIANVNHGRDTWTI